MRRKYLVHPSSQLKYIALTIFPALLIGFISSFLLITSGEKLILEERARLIREVNAVNYTVQLLFEYLEKKKIPQIDRIVERLLKNIIRLRGKLEMMYFNIVREWLNTKIIVFGSILLIIIGVGIVALLQSHRVVGPLYRLKRYIDLLSEGKEIPPVKIRRHDEFKELADSLEKLRKSLERKGILKKE